MERNQTIWMRMHLLQLNLTWWKAAPGGRMGLDSGNGYNSICTKTRVQTKFDVRHPNPGIKYGRYVGIWWSRDYREHIYIHTPLEFTPPWYPKLIFSTNIPFQTQNTPLQNCVPSLGSFPSPWTVYPDFDSCYSHFMPYRMTPSVRHRAIEVHYYY